MVNSTTVVPLSEMRDRKNGKFMLNTCSSNFHIHMNFCIRLKVAMAQMLMVFLFKKDFSRLIVKVG